MITPPASQKIKQNSALLYSLGGVTVWAPDRTDRHKVIAFTFKWDDADSPHTDVTVEFAADGDGTRITFRQAPFSSEESRRSHEEGWRECLARLAGHLREPSK